LSDPRSETPADEGSAPPSVADQITRSLGSVWSRHASGRPSEISTEIHDSVVKCVFKDAVASFNAGPVVEDAGDGKKEPEESRVSNPSAYRHEAIAAVSRLTERKVVGFIPKHDKKTDIATETFILERPVKRN
jgi:hypothetical protein